MRLAASFNPMAEDELGDAVAFYELEAEGLGAALLDIVEHAVGQLLEFPHSGAMMRGPYRKKVLHRFPFSLIYTLKGDEIRILAMMHHKRRPFYWRGRR